MVPRVHASSQRRLQMRPQIAGNGLSFLINACRVQFFLDQAFADAPGLIGVHPNDNTATVWLRTEDLLTMIEQHGNVIHVTEM